MGWRGEARRKIGNMTKALTDVEFEGEAMAALTLLRIFNSHGLCWVDFLCSGATLTYAQRLLERVLKDLHVHPLSVVLSRSTFQIFSMNLITRSAGSQQRNQRAFAACRNDSQ